MCPLFCECAISVDGKCSTCFIEQEYYLDQMGSHSQWVQETCSYIYSTYFFQNGGMCFLKYSCFNVILYVVCYCIKALLFIKQTSAILSYIGFIMFWNTLLKSFSSTTLYDDKMSRDCKTQKYMENGNKSNRLWTFFIRSYFKSGDNPNT